MFDNTAYMQGGMPPVITLDGRRQQVDIYGLPAAIGRNGEEADVYLYDESISRIHCRFDIYQGGVTITDLYSTMGTKVEKTQLQPGQPYLIENGCRIRIGKLKFKVKINQAALYNSAYQPQSDPEPQQKFSFDEPAREYDYDSEITEPLRRKPEIDLGGEKTEVIAFSDIEKAFRFPKKVLVDEDGVPLCLIDKTPFVIGRRPEGTDFALDMRGVSKQHLKIERAGDEFSVTDLDSTNGVRVNGKRIPPGEAIVITEGDLIGIGENEYRFESE